MEKFNFGDDLRLRLEKSKDYIQKKCKAKPKIAIILGTGLSNSFLKNLETKIKINYEDIPYFYGTKINSHPGKMIFTEIAGKEVILMAGRVHYYEGYNIQEVVYPIHLLKELGIEILLVSSSVGGLNENLSRGELLLVRDHINLTSINPLIGYDDSFGGIFLNSSNIYDTGLISLAEKISSTFEKKLKKGVMFFLPGPNFETKAELKAMTVLGADTIGWSTIPETIIAYYRGMKILAINCVTDSLNFGEDTSMENIISVADASGEELYNLIVGIIKEIR